MASPPTTAEGATGPTVKWAQYLLVRRTLSYTQIDGNFGPATKTAAEEFQGSVNLTSDGIIGPLTWTALGGPCPMPSHSTRRI